MGFPPLLNLSTGLSTATLPGQTTKTAITEEFMFQNVAYWPTVYRTGGLGVSQPDKKTTDIANVLTLPAKRAGQAGRVMSTCRPLARLFLSPSSARAHSLKRGRALSVVKGQGRNKLLSLTVRHWSFQSRFQLREVSLVKGEFLLFQHPATSADHNFACVRSILTYLVTLTRYLNIFYILTGKTNSFKKLSFTILRFRVRILLFFELLNLPLHFDLG